MNDPEFTIEKDIEMPVQKRRVTSPLSIALRKMEIGDSMLLTHRERNSAFAIGHGLKIKLASRGVEFGKVRVWRVK